MIVLQGAAARRVAPSRLVQQRAAGAERMSESMFESVSESVSESISECMSEQTGRLAHAVGAFRLEDVQPA